MATCYVIGGGKGGVGKSTLAIHLAVHLSRIGKNVAVVDCDTKQRTAAKFFERTTLYDIPCETVEKDILRTLSAADRELAQDYCEAFDAVVFDAPGDIEISKPLFRIADVVVLPSRPQFPDVEELAEAALSVTAIRETRYGGLPETLVVLTQGDPRTKVAREAMQELGIVQRDLRIPVSLNQLHYSVKYSEAYSAYVALPDLKRAPEKPKEQIQSVVKEVIKYGNRAERTKHEAAKALGSGSAAHGSAGSGEGEQLSNSNEFGAAGNE